MPAVPDPAAMHFTDTLDALLELIDTRRRVIVAPEKIDNPAHHLELIAEAELLSIRYR